MWVWEKLGKVSLKIGELRKCSKKIGRVEEKIDWGIP